MPASLTITHHWLSGKRPPAPGAGTSQSQVHFNPSAGIGRHNKKRLLFCTSTIIIAVKRLASVLLLLIVTLFCLMGIRAEEEQPLATGDRDGKQIVFAPQTYPAQSLPYNQGSFAYGADPFPMSAPQLSHFNRIQDVSVPAMPWTYPSMPLGYPISYVSWRVNDEVDGKYKLKWWKKRFNRQALITIIPSPGW